MAWATAYRQRMEVQAPNLQYRFYKREKPWGNSTWIELRELTPSPGLSSLLLFSSSISSTGLSIKCYSQKISTRHCELGGGYRVQLLASCFLLGGLSLSIRPHQGLRQFLPDLSLRTSTTSRKTIWAYTAWCQWWLYLLDGSSTLIQIFPTLPHFSWD